LWTQDVDKTYTAEQEMLHFSQVLQLAALEAAFGASISPGASANAMVSCAIIACNSCAIIVQLF